MDKKKLTWVDVALSKDDKEAILTLSTELPKLVEGINTLLDDGYRFTFGYDTRSSCLVVHLYGSPDSENHELVLSSRARSAEKLIAASLHKHYVICERAWQRPPTEKGDDFLS